jgi:hypothetical protein
MKSSHGANDNRIDRTRRVWQRRTGRDVSDEDARQITENVIGFFSILAEWARAEAPIPANENDKASPADGGGCSQ